MTKTVASYANGMVENINSLEGRLLIAVPKSEVTTPTLKIKTLIADFDCQKVCFIKHPSISSKAPIFNSDESHDWTLHS